MRTSLRRSAEQTENHKQTWDGENIGLMASRSKVWQQFILARRNAFQIFVGPKAKLLKAMLEILLVLRECQKVGYLKLSIKKSGYNVQETGYYPKRIEF